MPAYVAKRWNFEDPKVKSIICDAFRVPYFITNYASCITLLIISIHRFLAIRFPLRSKIWITNRKMLFIILGSWLYVVALCLIPLLPQGKKCQYSPQKQWIVTMLIGNTLIPCLIIIACYIYIFQKAQYYVKQKLRGKRAVYRKHQEQSHQVVVSIPTPKFDLGAACSSLIIISAYILCWGPSLVYYLLKTLCPSCYPASFKDSQAENTLNFVMKLLTFLSGLVAPIVYCWSHHGFRQKVAQVSYKLKVKNESRKEIEDRLSRRRSISRSPRDMLIAEMH